jgi:hypothetical protein
LLRRLWFGLRGSAAYRSLEPVPEVAAKLKEPNTADRKFEDVVKMSSRPPVLVLVY